MYIDNTSLNHYLLGNLAPYFRQHSSFRRSRHLQLGHKTLRGSCFQVGFFKAYGKIIEISAPIFIDSLAAALFLGDLSH